MKKILISWTAKLNDFTKDGKVNQDGPTFQFHQLHYQAAYDLHILLSSEANEEIDTRTTFLVNELRNNFPNHPLKVRYLDLKGDDIINIHAIKPKVEALLLDLDQDVAIDIFFSPGTSAMQVSWYLIHMSGIRSTRLLQTIAPHKAKGQNELLEIDVEHSNYPQAILTKQKHVDTTQPYEGMNDIQLGGSIKPIYEEAQRLAQYDIRVLIYGESGVGKEHLANFVHANSSRKNKPYEAINCSAFSDQLLESRLFGYKKGAFTDAQSDQKGILEQIHQGIIFLDEIGDISPYMQQVLLRFLQNGEIQPIGGKTKKVDVRVIAATNKNLEELVNEGKFRADLYYRLSVVELTLPKLMDRGVDEVEELLNFFIKRKRAIFNREYALKISKAARKNILSYGFPGNIRELEHLVENLHARFEIEVQPKDLPAKFHQPDKNPFQMRFVEKNHLKKVLEYFKSK